MKNAPRVAVIEAMFTTEPVPRAIGSRATRCGHTARVTRKTICSSFRMVNAQSSQDSVVIGPNRIADALLTRMSTPPYAATASATQAFAPASADRSTGAIAVISPPASRARRTVSAEPSGSRSQPTTAAPSRASVSAVARPIPPAVPVTRATLPARRVHPSISVTTLTFGWRKVILLSENAMRQEPGPHELQARGRARGRRPGHDGPQPPRPHAAAHRGLPRGARRGRAGRAAGVPQLVAGRAPLRRGPAQPVPVPAAGRGGRPDVGDPAGTVRAAAPAAQPAAGGRGRGHRGHPVRRAAGAGHRRRAAAGRVRGVRAGPEGVVRAHLRGARGHREVLYRG